MAYMCDNCEKTVDHGHKVSHAKNRTKTLRRPNLHNARVLVSGKIVKQRLCTKCLRRADRPHKQEQQIVVSS
jgi:large subunit ribosomal protein L28